jgi:hypothetical protein
MHPVDLTPRPKEPPKEPFHKKDVRQDIVVPALRFVGGPKRLGLAAGALAAAPFYLFARKNRLEWPMLRTLAMGALAGTGAYYGSKPSYTTDGSTDAWINSLGIKTGSEAMDRGGLFGAVADLPGFGDSQRNFLSLGVAATPGGSSVTVPELAKGFERVTGAVTGGLLPAATRALEGALLGSAFGALAGLPPTGRKWAAGIGAVADALWGNRLLQTIGGLYD